VQGCSRRADGEAGRQWRQHDEGELAQELGSAGLGVGDGGDEQRCGQGAEYE
jgi:hypothetical protein